MNRIFNFLKTFIILFCLIFVCFPIFSFSEKHSYSKGLFYGKNIHSLFLIHQHLPGFEAAIKQPKAFTLYNSFYYSQAFSIYPLEKNEDGTFSEARRYTDFESFVFESGVTYAINDRVEIGGMWRLISYYGGFLDWFTQYFHGIFNFPNAGREFCPENEVFIDIKTNNGINLKLNQATVGVGDIDLWGKYRFFGNRYVDSAAIFGLKLPIGNLEQVTGSKGLDFTSGVLLDVYPIKYLSLFFQAGVVLPLNSLVPAEYKPYPMFNGIFAIEVSPVRFFSIVGQMNIRTSPVTGEEKTLNNLGIIADKAGSVQTNLLVGVVFMYKQWRFQVYFEEDTFTNTGTDYTACLSIATKIKTF